jgi:hypothetical protein
MTTEDQAGVITGPAPERVERQNTPANCLESLALQAASKYFRSSRMSSSFVGSAGYSTRCSSVGAFGNRTRTRWPKQAEGWIAWFTSR